MRHGIEQIYFTKNSIIQDNVVRENEKYNNLIYVDVIDNSYNISFKTLMG